MAKTKFTLTEAQMELLEFLQGTDEYVSADDIAFSLPYYRAMKPRTARSTVQKDALMLKRAYGKGLVDRCVVGKNSVGYKIGNAEEIYKSCVKGIRRHFNGIATEREVLKMAGLDGQMFYDGEQLDTMDVTRKEN